MGARRNEGKPRLLSMPALSGYACVRCRRNRCKPPSNEKVARPPDAPLGSQRRDLLKFYFYGWRAYRARELADGTSNVHRSVSECRIEKETTQLFHQGMVVGDE